MESTWNNNRLGALISGDGSICDAISVGPGRFRENPISAATRLVVRDWWFYE
ncbi:MAG: hypothetical protein V7727_20395 [Sneathiella sp.]